MPNATLPEDTSVKIPAAVLRNSARASEIHKQTYETTVGDPPRDHPPQDPPQDPPEPPPPPQDPPQDPPERIENGSPEQQIRVWRGRFEQEKLEKSQLADRVSYLERTLATMSAPPPPASV